MSMDAPWRAIISHSFLSRWQVSIEKTVWILVEGMQNMWVWWWHERQGQILGVKHSGRARPVGTTLAIHFSMGQNTAGHRDVVRWRWGGVLLGIEEEQKREVGVRLGKGVALYQTWLISYLNARGSQSFDEVLFNCWTWFSISFSPLTIFFFFF